MAARCWGRSTVGYQSAAVGELEGHSVVSALKFVLLIHQIRCRPLCHSVHKRKITAITEARSWKVIEVASDRKTVCYFLFVVWKSLRDDVTSTLSVSSFRRHLKTYLFDSVTRVSNTGHTY